MKSLALSIAMAVLAGGTVAIPASAIAASPASQKMPLPGNSVYQLDVQLTDQAGRTSAWRDRRGKPQLVSMFYTSCQYICPLIVDSGKAIEKSLTPDERVELIARYLKHFAQGLSNDRARRIAGVAAASSETPSAVPYI